MAYEDFTQYTEVDPNNRISTPVSTKCLVEGITGGEVTYSYLDYSTGYFSGDFIHTMEVEWGSVGATIIGFYGLTNNLGDFKTIDDASQPDVILFHYTNRIYIQIGDADGQTQDFYQGQHGNLYFITLVRNDSGGANSKGLYTVYIRTGSHAGVLVDTLVVDAGVNGQIDFRYLNVPISYDQGSATAKDNIYTQNLNLNEVAVSPYEDFTTYTKVDPNNEITIVPNRMSGIFERDNGFNIFYDGGDDFIAEGDYTHEYEIHFTVLNAGGLADLVVCSGSDTVNANINSHNNVDCVSYYQDDIYLQAFRGGVYQDVDMAVNVVTAGIHFYITRTRIGTTHTLFIRTESHKGPLTDTLVAGPIADASFRYVPLAVGTAGGVASVYHDAYVQNLNLNILAIVAIGKAFNMTEAVVKNMISRVAQSMGMT